MLLSRSEQATTLVSTGSGYKIHILDEESFNTPNPDFRYARTLCGHKAYELELDEYTYSWWNTDLCSNCFGIQQNIYNSIERKSSNDNI